MRNICISEAYILRPFGLVRVAYAFALTWIIYWIFMMSISLFYFSGRDNHE